VNEQLVLLILTVAAGAAFGLFVLTHAMRWALSRMAGRSISSMMSFGAAILALALTLASLVLIGNGMIARVETVEWQDLTPLPGAKFAETKLGRIHYIDVGSGPTVLLMHGSGSSVATWREGIVERLSAHHRVIACDYFGKGFSERSDRFTYGYDLWVNESIELLDELGIARVTVIGHSVGGTLVCVLAADHPERVDHVVTIGTGITIDPEQLLPLVPGVGEIIMANLKTFGTTYSERHRTSLEAAYRVKGTRAALLAYIRRQYFVDGFRLMSGTFEDIKVPVLHLSGSSDVNIPPAVARDLTTRTGGKFVSIEDASHWAHIDAPDRVVEEIEVFLAETAP